jgi:hypothetical protein
MQGDVTADEADQPFHNSTKRGKRSDYTSNIVISANNTVCLAAQS